MASSLDPAPEPRQSALRKLLPVTTVGILIAAGYTGYTLYSRHEANVEAQKAAEQRQHEAEQQANEGILQHGELSILTFGADNGLLRRGETTELCYGVVNAKSVKIDPPVEETKPSYRHCLQIAPRKTTTYTLTATGSDGQSKTSTLTIQVR